MNASFQVIRDGAIIFEAFFENATPKNLPRYSLAAVEKFHLDHPDISLIDDDVIMKWAEWEEPGSEH